MLKRFWLWIRGRKACRYCLSESLVEVRDSEIIEAAKLFNQNPTVNLLAWRMLPGTLVRCKECRKILSI
jgi:hypothetical protein